MNSPEEHPLESRLRRHLAAEPDVTGSGAGAAAVSARAAGRRTRQRVAMLALTLAVVGGGVFAAVSIGGNDTDPLDVAAGDDASDDGSSDNDGADDDSSADNAAADAADNSAAETTDPPTAVDEMADATATAVQAGPAINSVVIATGDGFARLDTDYIEGDVPQATTTLFTSADGIAWDAVGPTDIPATVQLNAWGNRGIVPVDDGYLAIANNWDGAHGDLLIGTTTDLQSWTFTPLPLPSVDLVDGLLASAWADRAIPGPDGVLIHGSQSVVVDYPALLEPELLDSFCGEQSDGRTIDLFDCERDEVIASFGPGDAFFEASIAAQEFWELENQGRLTWKLDGGTATIVDDNLDDIFFTGIAATDSHYVGIGSDGNGTTTVMRSTDGVTWETLDAAGSSFSAEDVFQSIMARDNTLIVAGSCEGNAVVWRSTDNGASWEMTLLVDNNDGTTSAFVDINASGDAGFAVAVTENPFFDEMMDEPDFSDAEPISVDLGGATLTIDLANDSLVLVDETGMVLTDAAAILDEGPPVNWTEDTAEFLDENGDVVFTAPADVVGEAFDQAWSGDMVELPMPPGVMDEPVQSMFTSVDGQTWTQLNLPPTETATWITTATVGDDEVLISRRSQPEMPEELLAFEREERDPTDEENRLLQDWLNTSGTVEWLRFPL